MASSNIFGSGGAVSDIFSGVGDFFQAAGEEASSKAYAQGAQYAQQNAQLAQESENLQEVQAQRQITQTIGAEKAETGAAGLASGGSAQYLLASSVSQGAITKQLIGLQGSINVNAYNEEATALEGQAAAAKDASTGSGIAGIGSTILGLFALSDARAKTELHLEGRRKDGIGIYTFEYRGDPSHTRYMGVIAQEVQSIRPEAVIELPDGFLAVNYSAIGATFGQVGHA
jgi:hypothetical protein